MQKDIEKEDQKEQKEKLDFSVRNDLKSDEDEIRYAVWRYFKDKLDELDKSAVDLTNVIQYSEDYNYNPNNRHIRNLLEGRVDFTWGEVGIMLKELHPDPKEFVDYIIEYAMSLGKMGKINNGKEYDTTPQ